jgi:alpha-ketoglutarate-dependent taurine dioxygenase
VGRFNRVAYVNYDDPLLPSQPQSSSQSTLVVGATMSQLLKNAAKLATDLEMRKQVEANIRAKLNPGDSFWIDNMGIGHFQSALYVSNQISDKRISNDLSKMQR